MFASTQQWFRRNRRPLAIGLGAVGACYMVTQYLVSKINDARERMSSDRVAKENLRRRFEQNQEDCTFTVLALLPTATNNILEAMNTEKITYEIQQMKGSGKAGSVATRSVGSLSPPSLSDTNATDEDHSMAASLQSESGVVVPAASTAAGDTGQEQGQQARKTKRQLWDDLTISAITRAYTLLYTLGLLTMLTRIQLNLLGRRSYLASVVSLAMGSSSATGTINLENNDDDNASPEQMYGCDLEVNRKYLTFSWWLLNRGCVDIMQRVEMAVRETFGHLSPRDSLTLDAFAKLTKDARRLIEGAAPGAGAGTKWLPLLLPPRCMEDFVLRESGVLDDDLDATEQAQPQRTTDPTPSTCATPESTALLRRLMDETADLVESPYFSQVLGQLLDTGFVVLLSEKLTLGAFEMQPNLGAGSTAELASSATSSSVNRAVLLPKVLSVLTRQAHAIGNGMPNEYFSAMEAVRDLEGFAAVVYSSNWEAEIARDGAEATKPSDASDKHAAASNTRPPPYSGPGIMDSAFDVSDAAGREEIVASSQAIVGGEGSIVVVDSQTSFESAWERANEKN